jgi:gamma-glutamyltranspeptidase/glutathione hydrolase
MEFNTSGILSTPANIRPNARPRQCARRRRGAVPTLLATALLAVPLAGCDSDPEVGHRLNQAGDLVKTVLGFETGDAAQANVLDTRYLGSIAADDTQVVDLGRRTLLGGGSAADAASVMALALTVTQPGRAGLAGGGACLVKPPGGGAVEELDFPAQKAEGGTLPVPGLMRGLAALEARYGRLRWQQIVAPVEALATTGMTVTPNLLSDLQAAGLGTGGPGGVPLKVGDILPQRAVSASLATLRTGGAAVFYTGSAGGELVEQGVPGRALANYAPVWRAPASVTSGTDRLYFPQNPAGAAALASWQAVQAPAAQAAGDPAARFAVARVAAFPAGSAGIDQPAGSTGFLATDAAGTAVTCAIGMGRLFGSGQIIEPFGIFAAVPFDGAAAGSLVPILVTDTTGGQLRAALAGAGSYAAPADTAAIAASVLHGGRGLAELLSEPRTPAESVGTLVPDRIMALDCPSGLTAQTRACFVQHDPRGGGFSMHVEQLAR